MVTVNKENLSLSLSLSFVCLCLSGITLFGIGSGLGFCCRDGGGGVYCFLILDSAV
jgi:hypothetical protein